MPKKTEAKTKEEIKKKLTQTEFEARVIELANKGLTSEKIGEQLRKEGSHPREYNKKISRILKEKGKYTSPDLKNIEKKLERVQTQYNSHKQDKRAKREKERIFSQLRKLKKYLGVSTR